MIKLSSRQTDLFRKLVDKEKVTVQSFAQENHISVRTVYREIDNINREIALFRVKIVNRGESLALEGNGEQIINLKLNIPGVDSVLKVENRKNLILGELLQGHGPVKTQYFASKFHVSNAAVSYYLKDIKEWLEGKNISLISKPGVGIYIEAEEKAIRQAIIDLLYKNYSADELAGFLQKSFASGDNAAADDMLKHELDARLLNMIDYHTIKIIEKALLDFEEQVDYQIEDRLYIELSIHLALAIRRLLNGERIDLDSKTLADLKKAQEYTYAEMIARFIEKEIPLEIPEAEIGYMTIHLQGVRIGSRVLQVEEQYLATLTAKIIKEASDWFALDFRQDQTLQKDLKTHLLYSLYRLRSGFKIRNPLVERIKEEYARMFDGCRTVLSRVLGEDSGLEVTDDEVGYVTMHFLASQERLKGKSAKIDALLVCASGIGTSRMLVAKLKNVPQLNVVATASVLKIAEAMEKYNPNVILSTIPLQRDDIKVIVINPLFLPEDVRKLERELNVKISFRTEEQGPAPRQEYLDQVRAVKDYGTQVSILTKNVCFAPIHSRQSDEIVTELLLELAGRQLLGEAQVQSLRHTLLDREGMGTIVLPKRNFAIYHCASAEIREPMVAVGRLDKPAQLLNLLGKKEKVTTAFLMLAPAEVRESLEVIGDISAAMIEEGDFVSRINASSGVEECRALLEEALLKKLSQQITRLR
ncbi:protein-Npi-phosphohistidine-sugar phosphotransferase [Acididesulfobacillus acetoxydans]|uniref:Protein-Npi-phosphohistidine-sugar phosphotransferase n=1 Tax=Acididesulfobacillus acetoxydans TaxID=1561005 RepID=A0A8S0WA05_9FIRM|nr:BglG family transcription antiterminator [Acididesulfobacillus acetoxydans]CAA7603029.1 protein-Npi-phosphohistidine-sugar phosphotransferase [Acididesulfobacillus acetoxydans]CEJ08988.1 Transcriptional regulator MtlR [Acididesulfobacillus acetoxydans]